MLAHSVCGLFCVLAQISSPPTGFTGKGHKMKSLVTKDANNRDILVEVSEDFYINYTKMEDSEKRVNRKETRRHQSLDISMESGFDFIDKQVDVFKEVVEKISTETLHEAILKLQPSQQELIRRVYFKGEKMVDIARKEGIADSSVRHRLKRALKSLKKYLEKTATICNFRGY